MQPPATSQTLLTFGVSHDRIKARLGGLIGRGPALSVTLTEAKGCIGVHVCSDVQDPRLARDRVDQTLAWTREQLGPWVFTDGSGTLEESLVAMLRDRGRSAVTAESCTGGLVAKRITDVPTASRVYAGGWIVYADRMKQHQLGVAADLITRHGAVSEPVVRAMALGAVQRSQADVSVAVSGIAGPGGGTVDKPVGTVWIAVGVAGETRGGCGVTSGGVTSGGGGVRVLTLLCQLGGDRSTVRDRAADYALQAVRLVLSGSPLGDLCGS